VVLGGPPNADPLTDPLAAALDSTARRRRSGSRVRDFPYWLVAILAFLGWMVYSIATNDTYNEAWHFIIPGLSKTIEATLFSFLIALVIGLLAGLGRISKNVVLRNIALTYIEFIRGVPILVLLATMSYVVVPQVSTALGFENSSVSFFWRATAALSIIYGAYLAEVFRAGIESIPVGQTEAGQSLGMSDAQTMRLIVLPQAVRNMTPAIGNDLIAMLKDSSLLSFVAVNELTQEAKLYASSTFEFRASYYIITMLYLAMTLVLSLLLRVYRRHLGLDRD
jgi:polar amino acid transport system permease protein